MKFIHLPRQSDFGMYPHGFAVPGHRYETPHNSQESLLFWAGVQWCNEQFGRENQGHLYFTGTWAISGPQKPRIFMASAQDGFAFKMRWC